MNSTYYNSKVLSEQERREFCKQADRVISDFIESIDILYNMREKLSFEDDGWFIKNEGVLIDLRIFTSYCHCDIMVLTKQFILSTHYYERAFTYGKLKVVLNESFKKLYGFTEGARSKSYFAHLKEVAAHFPQFNDEFETFTADLEKECNNKTWWKEERDAEVHMDIEILDRFRNEDIYESQVVQDVICILEIFDRIDRLESMIHKAVNDYRDNLPTVIIFEFPDDSSACHKSSEKQR